MLIILIDCWQVLSCLIRVPLLNQANHAIWQKLWFTSIVLTVFSWSLKVNASKEEKRARPFSSSTPRRKKTTKSFCRQRVDFEISRERQGPLLQSRKMTKRWQSSWKTHWNYRGINFHEFVSEQSEIFRLRSSQARDKVTRGPAPYKNQTKYCENENCLLQITNEAFSTTERIEQSRAFEINCSSVIGFRLLLILLCHYCCPFSCMHQHWQLWCYDLL